MFWNFARNIRVELIWNVSCTKVNSKVSKLISTNFVIKSASSLMSLWDFWNRDTPWFQHVSISLVKCSCKQSRIYFRVPRCARCIYVRYIRINRALTRGICNWTRFESLKENIKNEIAAGPIKQNKQNDQLEWRNMNSEIRWFFTWPVCGFACYRVHSSIVIQSKSNTADFPSGGCVRRDAAPRSRIYPKRIDVRTSRSTSFKSIIDPSIVDA